MLCFSKKKSNIVGIHCCGHKLELAIKDALKISSLAEKVTTLLSGLYYFYRNSALNRTNLKGAYKFFGLKILLPTRANGTRWVSHVSRALDHFVQGYKAFRLHFEQLVNSKERGDSKAKAQGFLKLIKAHDIVAMALFLQDVLFILKKVSLKFQEESSLVLGMALAIKTTISQLQILKSKDGPYFQKFNDFEISDGPSQGTTTRSLVQLIKSHSDFQRQKVQLLQATCDALSMRFEHGMDAVISATSVANFKQWPLQEVELQGLWYIN